MIVQVLLNTSVTKLNRVFDYVVPNNLEQHILPYKRVTIPFGTGNKTSTGLIVNIKDTSTFDKEKLKSIIAVEDNIPLICNFKLKLANWMAQRYICNVADCINLFLPPSINKSKIDMTKEKYIKMIKVNDINIDEIGKITKTRLEKLDRIKSNYGVVMTQLDFCEKYKLTTATLKWYIENKFIEIYNQRSYRDPFKSFEVSRTFNIELNTEQKNIYNKVSKMLEINSYKEVLIHGITGSGKTEVYIQLIEKCISINKNALVLVPEISLTPQMTQRLTSRFGDVVAILHSKLSQGERYDQWDKINNNSIKIVIGARSAIFSPLKNIGLVIIDEEHDDSYKSDTSPKYDTKELAQKICSDENAVLLYGSATPSVKTYYRAEQGEIEFFEIKNRVNNAELPLIKLIELKDNLYNDSAIFTKELYNKIIETINKKEQIMLYINKRGYYSSIICSECGYGFKCPNCDVSLNYHHDKKLLLCHYCGHAEVPKSICPDCGKKAFDKNVLGIQKVEDEIKKLFPSASYIRMDKDTTSKKDGHIEILNKFKDEKIDILIGTQMITKGHDFPNVTLVGVLNADRILYIQSYNCNETAFSTLTQVAGRAGRNDLKGEVLLQTYDVSNCILNHVVNHDYVAMYKSEIDFRKTLNYPPFCDIISMVLFGKNEQDAISASKEVYSILSKLFSKEIQIYEPVPALIPKLNNKYRWKLVIKCQYSKEIANILKNIKNKFENNRISIDININSAEE